MKWLKIGGVVLLVLFALSFAFTVLMQGNGGVEPMYGGSTLAVDASPSMSPPMMSGIADGVDSYESQKSMSPESMPASEDNSAVFGDKITKSGNMTVESDDTEGTITKIHGSMDKYEAVITNESMQGGDYPGAYISVVVPAKNYEAFVADLRKNNKVASYGLNTDDETKAYQDQDAQLKAAREEQAAVDVLLNKAKTIDEILRIREQSKAIRQEIAVLEAGLKNIDQRVTYSTLSITVQSPQAVKGEANWWTNTMQQIVMTLQNSVRTFLLFITSLLPLFVLGGIIWGIIVIVRKAKESRIEPNE